MDFWDWYTRRLLADKRFPRDVVARKSFSKLRGAIAGLYAVRGHHAQAERAFRESRTLYVASPEANLRLVQEVLLPFRRFDEALALLEKLQHDDPNNTRMPGILEHVRTARATSQRLSDLTEKGRRPEGLNFGETLDLADCYLNMGRPDVLPQVLQPLVDGGKLEPRQLYEVGMMYAKGKRFQEASDALLSIPETAIDNVVLSEEGLDMASVHASAGRFDAAVKVLTIHLRRDPRDWRAWLDYATMNLRLRRGDQAAGALQQALRIDGEGALRAIHQSPELLGFYNHLVSQRGNGVQTAPLDGPRIPAPRR